MLNEEIPTISGGESEGSAKLTLASVFHHEVDFPLHVKIVVISKLPSLIFISSSFNVGSITSQP